jgi:glutamine synthetase adenylyltransferase
VDGARDELLARPALARHEHARRALGRAPDLLDELLDRGLSPTSSPWRPAARRSAFASASARVEAERRLDGDEERVGVERLLEEVERAERSRARPRRWSRARSS